MSNINHTNLTWVEISKKALTANIKSMRRSVGKNVLLAPAVKGNAYGHGIIETAQILLDADADWLCVNALFEAEALRKSGITAPIYIMGYVMKSELEKVVAMNCRLVVYNTETIDALSRAARKVGKTARVHIKMETGTNRQGMLPENVVDFAKYILKKGNIEIEGIATHFANIEDTADTSYADFQLKNFARGIALLRAAKIEIPIHHCANSAATMLFPHTHMNMVRPGISVYGLWPSEENRAYAQKLGKKITLHPALSWRTRIAQIKTVSKGEHIGYGCTYKTKQKTRLAVLPIGYYDGYDRTGLSNRGVVLIRGKRAPVRGRIFMNMIVVDVTKIPEARTEDIVTLLGKDGREEISAEFMAELCGTINYEITTRINEKIPRVVV